MIIRASVHCSVVFQFGTELQFKLLQLLLFQSFFDIFSKLNLLSETQNLRGKEILKAFVICTERLF